MSQRFGSGKCGSIYEHLEVPRLINAAGTLTRLGGTLDGCRGRRRPWPRRPVASCAWIKLHAAAGQRIAEWTGAEAGLVTAGAAASLTLAAAACLAGHRLCPHGPTARYHRHAATRSSSHARTATATTMRCVPPGARLVEVGLAERTRDPQPWEIAAAINERTVAVAFSVGFSPLPLADVVEVAHRHAAAGDRRCVGRAAAASEPAGVRRRRAPTWWRSAAARRFAGRKPRAFCAGVAISSPRPRCKCGILDFRPSCGIRPTALIDPGDRAQRRAQSWPWSRHESRQRRNRRPARGARTIRRRRRGGRPRAAYESGRPRSRARWPIAGECACRWSNGRSLAAGASGDRSGRRSAIELPVSWRAGSPPFTWPRETCQPGGWGSIPSACSRAKRQLRDRHSAYRRLCRVC